MSKLSEAVQIVNTLNREGAPEIVCVVTCAICEAEFASQVQDARLAEKRGTKRVCPKKACKDEARRRRQRGEWKNSHSSPDAKDQS